MFAYSTRTAAKTAAIMAVAIMAIVVIGAAAPVPAKDGAQKETTDRLLVCDSITDPAEKLACYDSVVENLKQSPAAPAASSPLPLLRLQRRPQ